MPMILSLFCLFSSTKISEKVIRLTSVQNTFAQMFSLFYWKFVADLRLNISAKNINNSKKAEPKLNVDYRIIEQYFLNCTKLHIIAMARKREK